MGVIVFITHGGDIAVDVEITHAATGIPNTDFRSEDTAFPQRVVHADMHGTAIGKRVGRSRELLSADAAGDVCRSMSQHGLGLAVVRRVPCRAEDAGELRAAVDRVHVKVERVRTVVRGFVAKIQGEEVLVSVHVADAEQDACGVAFNCAASREVEFVVGRVGFDECEPFLIVLHAVRIAGLGHVGSSRLYEHSAAVQAVGQRFG